MFFKFMVSLRIWLKSTLLFIMFWVPLRKRSGYFFYQALTRSFKVTNFVYLSKERIRELEKDLAEFKTKGRKVMAEKIAEARSHGDLSENAEYDAAKEEQGLMELRISKLEEMLSRARVIDVSSMPKDQAHILSKLKVKNLNNSKIYNYTLVSPEEADIDQGKISISSPVGQSLMATKSGQVVQAKVPAGVIKFQVLEIE
jgi:transcription elongation factor GreA